MKPTITSIDKLLPLYFEKYLPSAFDNGFTIVEKLNLVIDQLNRIGLITNEVVDRWNNLMDILENDELQDYINEKMEEWKNDGTLEKILNDLLIKNYATIEWVQSQLTPLEVINIYLDHTYIDNTKISESEYQFKSIPAAFNFLMNKPIKPKKAIIQYNGSGYFKWEGQVIIKNYDASYITLKGNFEIAPTSLTECFAIPSSPSNYEFVPALYGKMSNMPYLAGEFKMIPVPIDLENNHMDTCQQCQASLADNKFTFAMLDCSSMVCTSAKVIVKDFPCAGFAVFNGSHLTAHGSSVYNIGNRSNLVVGQADKDGKGDGFLIVNSTLSANKCHADYCGGAGWNITQGASADLDGSQSVDCGHHGLLVTGASNASFKGGSIDRVMDDNMVAYAGSQIDARDSYIGGNANSRNYGLIATMSSKIHFNNGVLNGTQYGIMANRNSQVDATNSSITNYPQTSVEADSARSAQGSVVLLTGATINNRTSGDACTAEHGGRLIINNATISAGPNGKTCVMAYDGDVFGQDVTISGGNNNTILATRGGKVDLFHSTITGVNAQDNECVHAYGGEVQINECKITNAFRAIVATRGGRVTASYGEFHASDLGVLAYGTNVDITGSEIYAPIQATMGGCLNASYANFHINKTKMVQCYNGSQVHLNEAKLSNGSLLTRTNVNKNTNNLTNLGVIYYDENLTI